jgi:predicted  nucleic acid-binding Zn-ribbon protein
MTAEQKAALKTAVANVEVSIEGLEAVKDSFQEAFDAMSEKGQEGEKGIALSEEINAIEECTNALTSAIADLDIAGS